MVVFESVKEDVDCITELMREVDQNLIRIIIYGLA